MNSFIAASTFTKKHTKRAKALFKKLKMTDIQDFLMARIFICWNKYYLCRLKEKRRVLSFQLLTITGRKARYPLTHGGGEQL